MIINFKKNKIIENDEKPKKTKKIINMKRIWQRDKGISHPNSACGPTVAAMVTTYFSQKGFINYKSLESAELVNLLYQKIGTLPWGTSINRWSNKMERFLNRYTFKGRWHIETLPAENNFLTYCDSISQDFPVILRFTFNFSQEAFASYHYVIGIGYRINETNKYIAVLDPDGGKNNDAIHWIKWELNEPYMKLLLFKHQSE